VPRGQLANKATAPHLPCWISGQLRFATTLHQGRCARQAGQWRAAPQQSRQGFHAVSNDWLTTLFFDLNEPSESPDCGDAVEGELENWSYSTLISKRAPSTQPNVHRRGCALRVWSSTTAQQRLLLVLAYRNTFSILDFLESSPRRSTYISAQ
jgi:hypothetical protein